MKNVRDIMRNSEKVLNSLMGHSENSAYKFNRLYRIMFNEEMYYVAYQNIYANQGNMTKGIDGKTADQMSLSRIENLIDTLKNEMYQPHPSRRVYIPKKNGKKRPLGIPSFEDKLVQEVIRMVLEAIYEGYFEYSSHGFRPKRSCHTALSSIQNTFSGVKWFIEGDIKGFFDNINHQILINILKERIDDERFINLIRKFLNAGYIEDWTFHRTYSGTPQGGIISPILANIYLDKFDKYMKEYIQDFDSGKKRKIDTRSSALATRKGRLSTKLKNEKDPNIRKQLIADIREIEKERAKIPHGNEMDDKYRRLKYVRYADDFLIGVTGSNADCIQIKEDISKYMENSLKLELSAEKTLITNAKEPAKFLGYDIFVRKSNDTKRDKNGILKRAFNGKIVLYVSTETIRRKLESYDAIQYTYPKGKEVWKSKARNSLMNYSLLDILDKYNAEIRGFYNYYSLANNSGYINSFYHIMEYSMYKTFSGKLESSVSKVIDKFKINKEFAIPYNNEKGITKYRIFYNEGFKRKKKCPKILYSDILPNRYIKKEPSLIRRLQTCKCELCGANGEVVMFQVKNIKKLNGEKDWERLMINKNRKTLVVCEKCNRRIHDN